MRPHLRFLRSVLRHKWFVLVAGLKVGGIAWWRLLIHDWSKFTAAEWGPYVRRFGSGRGGAGGKAGDPDEFHRAWTHHWHLNAHHWEHWLVLQDDGALRPLVMPEHFTREMVADWMGAGRAYTGRWEVHEWFAKNGQRMNLHPVTRTFVEQLLRAPRG